MQPTPISPVELNRTMECRNAQGSNFSSSVPLPEYPKKTEMLWQTYAKVATHVKLTATFIMSVPSHSMITFHELAFN